MIKQIKENIWQICFEKAFGSCVYLIKLKENLIIIDTGSKENKEELLENLNKLDIKPAQINILILTHEHYDHTENKNLFSKAKIYDGENINELAIEEFEIIKAPGHTQTDICILYDDVLFSGDVIFDKGYIGRTDFPESSPEEMQKSLEKLKKINYKILCPGHLV